MDEAGEYRLSDAMAKALDSLGVLDNYVFITTHVEHLELMPECQAQHTDAEIQAAFDVARHTHALDLVREDRNKKLDDTDYLMQPDYPLTDEEKAAWQTYRQALRDLPSNLPDAIINPDSGALTGVVWPDIP